MTEPAEDGSDTSTRACLCGSTDQRLIVYCTQVGFSLIACGFFMHQIANGNDSGTYLPLLTSLLGVFVSTPSIRQPK